MIFNEDTKSLQSLMNLKPLINNNTDNKDMNRN